MHSKDIEYFDGNQKLISKVFYPDQSGKKRPAIMLFHALEGRTGLVLEKAEEYVKQGYIAFAVDMYGDAATPTTLDSAFGLIMPLIQNVEITRRRTVLAYQALKNCPEVDANKIGAIGFCFGGMCILELCRAGEKLTAGVCCHSRLSKSNLPTNSISTKLLVMQGFQDPQMKAIPSLTDFSEEMTQAGCFDWTFTFFGDAKHSFTDAEVGMFDPVKEKEIGREYNPVVAARAFRYAEDFFKEWL